MKEIEIILLVIQGNLFLILNRIATKAKGNLARLANLIQCYISDVRTNTNLKISVIITLLKVR